MKPRSAGARVEASGAVVLGRAVEVDGYAGRPYRVVTHIHRDHLRGLPESRRAAAAILATEATVEMLEALGHRLPRNRTLSLALGRSLELPSGERLTLVSSRHVIGSCQVLVETSDGSLIGYTSDFKLPGTPPMRDLDILVIDATYGDPRMVRKFKREIDVLFADLVATIMSRGLSARVLAYHGKLQEAMEILRLHGIDAPFVLPDRIYELTTVARRHGARISDYLAEGTKEADDAVRSGWFVEFQHMSRAGRPRRGVVDIILTGWLFDEPIKRVDAGAREIYYVALSDHADFEDTLLYLDDARPRLVVVDASRASAPTAAIFSREVRSRLGLEALPLPETSRRLEVED
ncbi:MAG: MBL fold metallo-hydrolase [Fervidicoccaceae archaeon]